MNTNTSLANLPSTATAELPEKYVAAKQALLECHRIDECKDWADKAAALASYAKQSEDEELYNTAARIRGRAIRRCGELLRELQAQPGQRTDLQPTDGAGPRSITRKQAAEDAGLSERQAKPALRVAAVPSDEFEQAIEASPPATVTELADQGTKPKPLIDLQGRDPKDFQVATNALGTINDILRRKQEIDVAAAVRGLSDREKKKLVGSIEAAGEWLVEMHSAVAPPASSGDARQAVQVEVQEAVQSEVQATAQVVADPSLEPLAIEQDPEIIAAGEQLARALALELGPRFRRRKSAKGFRDAWSEVKRLYLADILRRYFARWEKVHAERNGGGA